MKDRLKAKSKATPSQSKIPVAKSKKSRKSKLPPEGQKASPPSYTESHQTEKVILREDAKGFLDRLTEICEPNHLSQIRESFLFSNILANNHRVPINDVLFLAGLLLAPGRGIRQEESWHIAVNWLEEQGQRSHTDLLGLDAYGIHEHETALHEIGEMNSSPFPETPVRREVFDVLEKAKKLAEKVTLPTPALSGHRLSVRHLLAQILWGGSLRVKTHFRRLNYDLGELKQVFFPKVTDIWRDTDHRDAWADFLKIDRIESPPQAVNDLPEPIDHMVPEVTGPKPAVEESAIPGESGPEPLFVLANDDLPEEGEDVLGVRRDVRAICTILASQDVHLPLSLGLFGDWGTGKTYFMDRMYEGIECLARASHHKAGHETAYCQNILQIRFTAWNFIDANPWSVMVTQILDEIYTYLSKASEDSWQNTVRILEHAKGLFAEAQYALQQANNSVIAAETSLQSAQKAREQREMEVQRQFNSLKILLGVKAQIDLRKAARRFGWGEELQSVEELSERIHELKSRSGRLRNFFKVLTHSEYAIPSLGLLVFIILLPMGIGILVPHITQRTDFMIQVGVFIAQIGTLIVGGMAWLKKSLRWLSSGITELEEIQKKVEEIRQQRLHAEKVKADCELSVLREKESVAQENLRESEKRLKEAELELNQAQPSRRLFRLIEERTESEDYRSRLGIISLIRKDFESLSRLVNRGDFERDRGKMTTDGQSLESIPLDRILLYIDDLDHCSAQRVVQVLEVVHLLLAFPIFVVVVGADPRRLWRSLELHYPPLHAGSSGDRQKVFVSSRARAATPQNYLENIFQIPFNLTSMGDQEYQRLVRELVRTPKGLDHNDPIQVTDEKELDEKTQSIRGIMLSPDHKEKPTPILNPPALQLSSNEKMFMESLNPLLKTPRTVKKFINTYRIFRARLAIAPIDQFISTEGQPGEFQSAMILIGIITGFPAVATKALQVLLQQDVQGTWDDYVINLKAQSPTEEDTFGEDMPISLQERQVEWNRLCEALVRINRETGFPMGIKSFMAWASQVARFSFFIDPWNLPKDMASMEG